MLAVYGLTRPVDYLHDTWNNRPGRYPPNPLAYIQVIPNADGIVSGNIPCHQGTRMDFELAAKKNGPAGVHWFGKSTGSLLVY